MYLLTNERYKAYQTGFSFRHLGHAPGVGLEGVQGGLGGKKKILEFNQIWCVSFSHEWHIFFWSPTPGEGPKGQISLNFNYFVTFKNFKTKLCLSSHISKIQNILDGIFIPPPGSCPRGDAGGSKLQFSEHGHVAYQIKGDDQQTRIKRKILP